MNHSNEHLTDDIVINSYSKQFPITDKLIYLDHSGVAPLPLCVKEDIDKYLQTAVGLTTYDYEASMQRVEEVRASSAQILGAEAEEVAFVKNTSHGVSIVSSGLSWRSGDEVIIFGKDFPANIYPWLNLERKGVTVKYVPENNGRILVQDIAALITDKTRLVSMSSVQSYNGYMIDLKTLGDLCKNRGVLLFVDAIQSLGVVPLNVNEMGIDFLAVDGHKWLLAPEGIGIFYCRKDLAGDLEPALIGWKSVEKDTEFEVIDFTLKKNSLRFEEGSFNVLGIYGLGAALDLLLEVGIDRICRRVQNLGDLIISQAHERGFEIKTPSNRKARGGIVSFAGDFDPQQIAVKLAERKIIVNYRGGALRVSPHFYNTGSDISALFRELDTLSR